MLEPRALIAAAALLAVTGCASGTPPAAGSAELTRAQWVVEDVAGGGSVDGARVTATLADGRVAGRSGCNRYGGSYSHAGSVLKVGPLAGTRMACPPALMGFETRFLAVLGAATSARLDATGALILATPNGHTLKLRR